jgi:hypothetical protein
MKQFSYYSMIFGLFIFTCTGCSKKSGPAPVVTPDTTKPIISATKPTPGQVFTAGNTILFQATFSDNEKLKSYDIAISKKVLGGMVLKVVPTSTPFSYNKSSTSLNGGKSQDVSLSDITIPANTATNIVTPGTYNFKVTCVDGSDNTTSTTIIFVLN